jgi:hypothetical protein
VSAHEVHLSPEKLMLARNGETVVTRIADWESGLKVAFDVDGGEMAELDQGVPRVVLTPQEFALVAGAKGRGYSVTADSGQEYEVSVWA